MNSKVDTLADLIRQIAASRRYARHLWNVGNVAWVIAIAIAVPTLLVAVGLALTESDATPRLLALLAAVASMLLILVASLIHSYVRTFASLTRMVAAHIEDASELTESDSGGEGD